MSEPPKFPPINQSSESADVDAYLASLRSRDSFTEILAGTSPQPKPTNADSSRGPHLSDPVPKNWKDAVPSVLFGFYGLGFALEAVAAINRGDFNLFIWDSIACTLLTAVAVIWWKYRDWLPTKFVSTAI